MKHLNLLLVTMLLSVTTLFAQEYEITFGLQGETGTPETVLIENLTQGTSATFRIAIGVCGK